MHRKAQQPVTRLIGPFFSIARCSEGSSISTLGGSTWPFLTTRTRSLRAKPTTSVRSGPTTFSIPVGLPGTRSFPVLVFTHTFLLTLDGFAIWFHFRPLAPERQCGENVEISEELHHYQGTVDKRRVRRPLLGISACVKAHRCLFCLPSGLPPVLLGQ